MNHTACYIAWTEEASARMPEECVLVDDSTVTIKAKFLTRGTFSQNLCEECTQFFAGWTEGFAYYCRVLLRGSERAIYQNYHDGPWTSDPEMAVKPLVEQGFVSEFGLNLARLGLLEFS